MVKFISLALEKFLNTSQEDFTSIIITAISLSELIDEFDSGDKERLRWLRDFVHEDLMISIFKLDRLVDPTQIVGDPMKMEFPVEFKSDVLKDNVDDSRKKIKRYTNDIQKYLCNVTTEVSQIIFRNFKDYNDEFSLISKDSNKDVSFEFE